MDDEEDEQTRGQADDEAGAQEGQKLADRMRTQDQQADDSESIRLKVEREGED